MNQRRISIVIVEDHEATLKGLVAELGAEPDFEIAGSAMTSAAGLHLVEERSPAVVLLDLHLPDSAGPKSVTEAFSKFVQTKIVALSGETRPAIIQMVVSLGVSGYILKSEPLERVVETIRAIMKTPDVIHLCPANLLDESGPRMTNAEQHLLRLLARGMKYGEIAAERVVSPETVRKQIDSLVAKLNLHTREQLIAWAVENGYGKLELH